jgi:hypothetical protein
MVLLAPPRCSDNYLKVYTRISCRLGRAETAERHVAEAHEIREDLRDRLIAIRED